MRFVRSRQAGRTSGVRRPVAHDHVHGTRDTRTRVKPGRGVASDGRARRSQDFLATAVQSVPVGILRVPAVH